MITRKSLFTRLSLLVLVFIQSKPIYLLFRIRPTSKYMAGSTRNIAVTMLQDRYPPKVPTNRAGHSQLVELHNLEFSYFKNACELELISAPTHH